MEYTSYYLHAEKTILSVNTSTMGLTRANCIFYSEHSQGLDKNDFGISFSFTEDQAGQFAEYLLSPSQLHLGTYLVMIWGGMEEYLPPRIQHESICMILPDTLLFCILSLLCLYTSYMQADTVTSHK